MNPTNLLEPWDTFHSATTRAACGAAIALSSHAGCANGCLWGPHMAITVEEADNMHEPVREAGL